MPNRNFIIICEIRTGSTYLSRFLDGVDGIKMWTLGPDKDASYEIFRGTKKPLQTLREFYSQDYDGILGTKLPVRMITKRKAAILDEMKIKNLRPIFLSRESKVENLLSIIHAEETKIWHKFEGKGERKTKPINVKLERLYDFYVPHYLRVSERIQDIRDMINDKEPIDVTYESLVYRDGKKYVLNELGIEWNDRYEDISNEKKILSGGYKKFFENYDEVVDVIEEGLHV
jgi:hypothetical protein